MELATLIEEQIERDRRRGFAVDFDDDAALEAQLMRDVVGLVGEVGEFANALKRVSLARTTPGYIGKSLAEEGPHLREELADAAIYLFRLARLLDADLEAEVMQKIRRNDERYGHLER